MRTLCVLFFRYSYEEEVAKECNFVDKLTNFMYLRNDFYFSILRLLCHKTPKDNSLLRQKKLFVGLKNCLMSFI